MHVCILYTYSYDGNADEKVMHVAHEKCTMHNAQITMHMRKKYSRASAQACHCVGVGTVADLRAILPLPLSQSHCYHCQPRRHHHQGLL